MLRLCALHECHGQPLGSSRNGNKGRPHAQETEGLHRAVSPTITTTDYDGNVGQACHRRRAPVPRSGNALDCRRQGGSRLLRTRAATALISSASRSKIAEPLLPTQRRDQASASKALLTCRQKPRTQRGSMTRSGSFLVIIVAAAMAVTAQRRDSVSVLPEVP
jgi:hypothetical protein